MQEFDHESDETESYLKKKKKKKKLIFKNIASII